MEGFGNVNLKHGNRASDQPMRTAAPDSIGGLPYRRIRQRNHYWRPLVSHTNKADRHLQLPGSGKEEPTTTASLRTTASTWVLPGCRSTRAIVAPDEAMLSDAHCHATGC